MPPRYVTPYFMTFINTKRPQCRAATPLRGSASQQLGSFRQLPISVLRPELQDASLKMKDGTVSQPAQRSRTPSLQRPPTMAGSPAPPLQRPNHHAPPLPASTASRLRAAGLKIMAAKRFETAGMIQKTDDKAKAPAEEKPANALTRGYDESLSSAALRKVVAAQETVATQNEDLLANASTEMTAKLGEVLQKKFEEGMKNKDFFEELDRNGDGKVSKMEWRQCMRDLGITGPGSAYSVKEVDALFHEMDRDSNGELELAEVNIALKKLKVQFSTAKVKMSAALEMAEACRLRADQARNAADKVEIFESALAVYKQAVACPSAELRLGALLARRGLKPADAIAKFSRTGGAGASDSTAQTSNVIDATIFCQTMAKLFAGVTEEELKSIFEGLDSEGKGQLDTADLYGVLRSLQERKLKAAENEKKLAKAVEQVREHAIAAQDSMRLLLEQEAKQKAEKEEQEKFKQQADAEAAIRAKQEADAKAAAAAAAKEAQKAEFEARIQRRRMSMATPVMVE